ncbi:MAG: flavodoxin [Dehalococcoidia bacterium]|jgi:menaquinone-dependent protoporphyrinogen oxidase|nr:flavodoxin [Dehalococcoidia bacterium]
MDVRVLVAYSSKHGSTAELARSIALTLSRAGMDVDVLPAADVQDVRRYRVVILGSAVYGGRWRAEAVSFFDRFSMQLFGRDVWLFQSGPLGNSAQAILRSLPLNVGVYAEYLRVKGWASFGGKLDGTAGGPVARFLARAGFAGDYRDFAAVRLWAEDVARATALSNAAGRNQGSRLVSSGVR